MRVPCKVKRLFFNRVAVLNGNPNDCKLIITKFYILAVCIRFFCKFYIYFIYV